MRPLVVLLTTVLLAGGTAEGPAEPVALDGVPRAFRLSGSLYCGAQPEGDAGFRALAAAGVRTVLSVDGLPPDAAAAMRHGLRTVHVPLGYDGIAPKQRAMLARVLDELPGPVFVHCHHGRHRGPAAAAVVAHGQWSAAEVRRWLQQAGTGAEYRGLHRDAVAAVPDAGPVSWRESVPPPPLVRVMGELDAHLDAAAAGDRRAATLLREDYRELARRTADRDEDFRTLLAAAERHAGELERSFGDEAATADRLALVRRDCVRCHRSHRNGPPPAHR